MLTVTRQGFTYTAPRFGRKASEKEVDRLHKAVCKSGNSVYPPFCLVYEPKRILGIPVSSAKQQLNRDLKRIQRHLLDLPDAGVRQSHSFVEGTDSTVPEDIWVMFKPSETGYRKIANAIKDQIQAKMLPAARQSSFPNIFSSGLSLEKPVQFKLPSGETCVRFRFKNPLIT